MACRLQVLCRCAALAPRRGERAWVRGSIDGTMFARTALTLPIAARWVPSLSRVEAR